MLDKTIQLLMQAAKSKTMWAAVIMSLLTALEINVQLVTPLLPLSLQPYLPLVWGPVMVFFRFITNSALSDK